MRIKMKIAAIAAAAVCTTNMLSGTALPVNAEDLTYGDLTYTVIDEDSDGAGDYIEIMGCNKEVTEVEIPAEIDGLPVESIGDYAFEFCRNLTSLTISNSVTSIGAYAFNVCDILKSVTIPDSVTSIGAYAFNYCGSLRSIPIPESVTSIGVAAFSSCGIEEITIPKNVTSIGDYTFICCTNLKEIIIPENVTSIGDRVFEGCESLESITIENPDCEILGGVSALSETAVIHGHTGSTAQIYAENYGRDFVSIGEEPSEIIKGDITGDGKINLYDAIEICRYIMEMRDFSEEEMKTADYNGDEEVNLYDVIEIARYMMNQMK